MAFRKLVVFLFCIVTTAVVTAQNLIPHQYALGGNQFNGALEPFIMENGDYYVFLGVSLFTEGGNMGNLNTNQYGSSFIVVSKHNQNHDVLWQSSYGGDSIDVLGSVAELSDGFLMACVSNSDVSGTKTIETNNFRHIWLQKLSFDGDVIWQKGFHAPSDLNSVQMLDLGNGSFLLTTQADEGVGFDKTDIGIGSYDAWLIKIDSEGNTIWDKCIGTEFYDGFLNPFGVYSNGDILCGSYMYTGISGDKTEFGYGENDAWIVRVSSEDGSIVWDKTIGGEGEDFLYSGSVYNDVAYLFVESYSNVSGLRTAPLKGLSDSWFISLDANGQNILHQSSFGGELSENNTVIHSVSQNGLILGIRSNSNISIDKNENSRGEYDIWLVFSDLEGNILRQKTIGGSNNDVLIGLKVTNNGNYLLTAGSQSDISGEKTIPRIGPNSSDVWILEIDAVTLDIINQEFISNESLLYPNPSSSVVHISFNEATQINKAVLYDVSGKIVLEQTFENNFESVYTINVSGLVSGIYTLRLEGAGVVITRQVVVE
jgi:hypothetical protein